jgi:glycosyltransferase involved in cell wall biosynthesis
MWGISESKLKLIYNSVESKTRTAGKESQKVYNIVTVCRLVPWKGVDELIIYAAKRKKKMLVVGDGPEKSHLEALANSLQADVIFEGEVSQRRVLELLSMSELFVLNSRYEGLPHALVEARVAGILSVGRAGTGSAEVINDDQDGFLVRSDRPLEETLDLAIQMQPSSDSMIALAKEDSLKRFSKELNFPLILSLFLGEV